MLNWIPTNALLPDNDELVVYLGVHGEQINGVFIRGYFFPVEMHVSEYATDAGVVYKLGYDTVLSTTPAYPSLWMRAYDVHAARLGAIKEHIKGEICL